MLPSQYIEVLMKGKFKRALDNGVVFFYRLGVNPCGVEHCHYMLKHCHHMLKVDLTPQEAYFPDLGMDNNECALPEWDGVALSKEATFFVENKQKIPLGMEWNLTQRGPSCT